MTTLFANCYFQIQALPKKRVVFYFAWQEKVPLSGSPNPVGQCSFHLETERNIKSTKIVTKDSISPHPVKLGKKLLLRFLKHRDEAIHIVRGKIASIVFTNVSSGLFLKRCHRCYKGEP